MQKFESFNKLSNFTIILQLFMKLYTILTLLPSGVFDLIKVTGNILNEYQHNDILCNSEIGPILNNDDLEKGSAYYIHCNISKNPYCVNILMTDFIKRTHKDLYVNGPCYITKEYENKIVEMTTKDINNIFKIINETEQSINLRISDEVNNEYLVLEPNTNNLLKCENA